MRQFATCRSSHSLRKFISCQSLTKKSLIGLQCCWNIPPQATRCLVEPDCFPICLAVGSSPQCQVSHSAPEGISFEHRARPFPRGCRCYLAPFRRPSIIPNGLQPLAVKQRAAGWQRPTMTGDVAPPPPRQ